MCTKAALQQEAMEESLDAMAAQNAELRLETEKSLRDCRSLKEIHDRAMQAVEQERRNVSSAVDNLTKELNAASKTAESELARRLRLQHENAEHRLTIDKLRSQVQFSFYAYCRSHQHLKCFCEI